MGLSTFREMLEEEESVKETEEGERKGERQRQTWEGCYPRSLEGRISRRERS